MNGICIIRTHGATPHAIKQLEEKGCKIVDATCPDVKRVQDNAKALAEEGYQVIIIGKADHPEVIAIKAYADLTTGKQAIVISSENEVLDSMEIIKNAKKVGIVVQTTQTGENFKNILALIAEQAKELKVHNTICLATSKRQQEAKALAKDVELMVVVGSKSSANTTHLAEIVNEITETIHIETHQELGLYQHLLNKAGKIGVTAGASTPEFVIDEVIKRIGDKISV